MPDATTTAATTTAATTTTTDKTATAAATAATATAATKDATKDAAAAAAAAAKTTATAITADTATTTDTTTTDWRTAFGADEKVQKQLGRFASPEAFGKAYLEAVGRISTIKPPLKEGASAEEITAWRKDNGIPEKADGYFEKLPGGLVVGEDDKALFAEWATQMHGLNVPPAVVAETVKWYYAMQEQQTANQEAMDRQHQTETVTALRNAWGRDYTENMNLVKSFIGGLDEETQALFMDATMPDGRRLFNSPQVIQWLTQKARELNPLAFIPGAGAGDESKTLDQRIEAIEATMGTPAYLKNEKVQAELRALYERREQLARRGAA